MLAIEARRISDRVAREDEIFRMIREAAEEGRVCIYLSVTDWNTYGDKMTRLGYNVRPSTGSEGLCVRVGW